MAETAVNVGTIVGSFRGVVATVETEIGALEVVFTDGDHAHVTAPGNGVVTVRGKEFHASAHLYASHDWKAKDSGHIYRRFPDTKSVPRTVAAGIVAVFTAAAVAVIERDGDVLRVAQARKLAGQVEDAEVTANRLRKELGAALTSVADLRTRLLVVDPKGEYAPKGDLF